MDALFGKAFDLLSGVLDFRSQRHKVILSNIANIETVDYKPKELGFQNNLEDVLSRSKELELTRTHTKHFYAQSSTNEQFETSVTGDRVEIDKEMANLAENNLSYNFTVELLLRKFRGLNTVLKETK